MAVSQRYAARILTCAAAQSCPERSHCERMLFPSKGGREENALSQRRVCWPDPTTTALPSVLEDGDKHFLPRTSQVFSVSGSDCPVALGAVGASSHLQSSPFPFRRHKQYIPVLGFPHGPESCSLVPNGSWAFLNQALTINCFLRDLAPRRPAFCGHSPPVLANHITFAEISTNFLHFSSHL